MYFDHHDDGVLGDFPFYFDDSHHPHTSMQPLKSWSLLGWFGADEGDVSVEGGANGGAFTLTEI